jgi:hypothetical protein
MIKRKIYANDQRLVAEDSPEKERPTAVMVKKLPVDQFPPAKEAWMCGIDGGIDAARSKEEHGGTSGEHASRCDEELVDGL